MNKQEIYTLLSQRGLWHEITEHPAVYNMEEMGQIALPYPEADAKNLFVRDDKKRNYYLITVKGDKRVDLKEFKRKHGTRSLTFASEGEMLEFLGLTAGSVTPLGLLNDGQKRVKLYLDEYFMEAPALIGVHPNDNTATVCMKTEDLIALLTEYGSQVEVVEVCNMDELKQLQEVQTASEEIFRGHVVHLFKDTVALPNGKPATRETVRHIGAVAVVPLTDDGKVIVERQFRYPLNEVITEIPAGKLDSKSEDRLAAAKRELEEETGYIADEWISLGDYYPAAAYTDEIITMYLAKGLHKGERNLDEDEFLNVVEVPLEELVQEIMEGRIGDGKTQAAILKVWLMMK